MALYEPAELAGHIRCLPAITTLQPMRGQRLLCLTWIALIRCTWLGAKAVGGPRARHLAAVALVVSRSICRRLSPTRLCDRFLATCGAGLPVALMFSGSERGQPTQALARRAERHRRLWRRGGDAGRRRYLRGSRRNFRIQISSRGFISSAKSLTSPAILAASIFNGPDRRDMRPAGTSGVSKKFSFPCLVETSPRCPRPPERLIAIVTGAEWDAVDAAEELATMQPTARYMREVAD